MSIAVVTGSAGLIGSEATKRFHSEGFDVVGVDKASIKSRIRELKQKREEALNAHDHAQLKVVRRTIHRLKRQIHKATV